MTTKPEAVNHPAHYGRADDPYEVIKVLDAWNHLTPCLWNAIKYIARAGKKGLKIEDLEKAAWYVNHEIQNLKATIPQEELLTSMKDQGFTFDNFMPYTNCRGPCGKLLPVSELSAASLCRDCFDPNSELKKKRKKSLRTRATHLDFHRKKSKRRVYRGPGASKLRRVRKFR